MLSRKHYNEYYQFSNIQIDYSGTNCISLPPKTHQEILTCEFEQGEDRHKGPSPLLEGVC